MLEQIQHLILGPHDRLALLAPQRLSWEAMDRILTRLRAWVPDGVEPLVIDSGCTLQAIRGPRAKSRTKANLPPPLARRRHTRKNRFKAYHYALTAANQPNPTSDHQ